MVSCCSLEPCQMVHTPSKLTATAGVAAVVSSGCSSDAGSIGVEVISTYTIFSSGSTGVMVNGRVHAIETSNMAAKKVIFDENDNFMIPP